jgi:hypothetical protein
MLLRRCRCLIEEKYAVFYFAISPSAGALFCQRVSRFIKRVV